MTDISIRVNSHHVCLTVARSMWLSQLTIHHASIKFVSKRRSREFICRYIIALGKMHARPRSECRAWQVRNRARLVVMFGSGFYKPLRRTIAVQDRMQYRSWYIPESGRISTHSIQQTWSSTYILHSRIDKFPLPSLS